MPAKLLRATAIALALLAPALAAEPADKDVEIPLNEIWALDMPGTRDIRELNTPDDTVVESVLKQIAESRRHDHGFAVRGEGANALREFLRVRTEHDHWNRLPADKPVSLVLFTEPIGHAVVLQSIERRGTRVIPRFRFAPRESSDPSPNLALVSLGKLPLGQYYVTPDRQPAEQTHRDAGYEEPSPTQYADIARSLGCGFQIVEGPGGPPPPTELVEIPLSEIWAYEMPGTRDLNEFGAADPKESLVQKTLLQIRESWKRGAGMAVQGEGREALENLYRIHAENLSRNALSVDTPISLAFYTKGTQPLIHLEHATRRGNEFTLQYRPVLHDAAMSHSHLALVPVGKLSPGKYKVTVKQLPGAQLGGGFRQPPPQLVNSISSSYEFVVIGKR